MNLPPTKRLRGLDHEQATAFDDPFGDEEDFTQDDLDEIDVIASQAITSAAAGAGHGTGPVGSARPSYAGQSKPPNRGAAKLSRENAFGFNSSGRENAGIPSREPLGNRPQRFGSDRDEDCYSLLQAQHAQLKRKLKEVEEEIVVRSGEIRVLRDSLRAAQQEKEAQRQKQLQQEAQRQREQSDKEKELSRRVQSLQSELQFKEAEVNEMKTKLHSDRTKTSPLPRNSPKGLSCLAQVHHGSGGGSSSPAGNGFITKETFGAQVASRTTPMKARREGGSSGGRQEVSRPDPFLSARPAHLQPPGGVLLGLLLQQPLSPSSLSLSHLLSMSLTDAHLTTSGSSAAGGGGGAPPPAGESPVQSLAVTGLSMLSQSGAAAGGKDDDRSCPGAALLLPLLDLHLSRLCRVLDSLPSDADGSGSGPDSGPGGPTETGLSGAGAEDAGLAALRLLNLLLDHSCQVVEAVLADEQTPPPGAGPCSQNALLRSVLRLCEAGSQREGLVLSAMKTLCVLIERTPHTHTDRLQCVLQAVCVCLSADSRLQVVKECVSVLMCMCDHQTLVQQLCSQHDPCVFLKLFQFIRTRAESRAVHTDWVLLDLQVVRLLSRIVTQRAENWTRTCQCYTELVQTVVIVLHRQWLDLRGSGSQEPSDSAGQVTSHPLSAGTERRVWTSSPAGPAPAGPAPSSLLRESLLLLHWLLLHHGGFSQSCRPLLHLYDQVIPALRDTLRRLPSLSESEELALEEICRSEGDDAEDMDADT